MASSPTACALINIVVCCMQLNYRTFNCYQMLVDMYILRDEYMSWLFMIIAEFCNDVLLFYTYKSTKSHFVFTIAKCCFFLCFFSFAMWQHGYTKTLVVIGAVVDVYLQRLRLPLTFLYIRAAT